MVRMNVLMRVVLRTSVGLSEFRASTQQSISSKAQFQSIMSEVGNAANAVLADAGIVSYGCSLVSVGGRGRFVREKGTARWPAVAGKTGVKQREVVLE